MLWYTIWYPLVVHYAGVTTVVWLRAADRYIRLSDTFPSSGVTTETIDIKITAKFNTDALQILHNTENIFLKKFWNSHFLFSVPHIPVSDIMGVTIITVAYTDHTVKMLPAQ